MSLFGYKSSDRHTGIFARFGLVFSILQPGGESPCLDVFPQNNTRPRLVLEHLLHQGASCPPPPSFHTATRQLPLRFIKRHFIMCFQFTINNTPFICIFIYCILRAFCLFEMMTLSCSAAISSVPALHHVDSI